MAARPPRTSSGVVKASVVAAAPAVAGAKVRARPSARVKVAAVTAGPRMSGLEVAMDTRQTVTVSAIKP